jgi:predicted N-acetyltransferase YhbS
MKIIEIAEDNWRGILEIQEAAYHEVDPEELDVLKSKQWVSPETCFVCVSDQGDILGYLLAHPWYGSEPPKLYEPVLDIKRSDSLYLHDMAVSPHSKGQGIGRSMMAKLIEVAELKGVKRITLVAIQGADSFWSLLGFKVISTANIGASYGDNAVFMEKSISTYHSYSLK